MRSALTVLALTGLLMLVPAASASARECGRVSLPYGYSARVNFTGNTTCTTARLVVRDNLAKRLRRQTGGTGRTRLKGFSCRPTHGDEAMCVKGATTAFGYSLRN